MTTDTFDAGDGLRVTAVFTNLSRATADPTTVVFKLRDASGAVTLPAVVRTTTGVYYAEFVVTYKPGEWTYRWEGTGAVQAAEEGKFISSHFTVPLTSFFQSLATRDPKEYLHGTYQ
jgi:hypothetical protein